MALKSFKCVGNLPNKDSWTFNGVIFSHPVEFTRFEQIFIFFLLLVFIIREKVGELCHFDNKTLFRNESNLHTNLRIYSQYFALNSQCKGCSFSVCNQMKHTFSFHCVGWKKSWNMTAKTDVWTRKVNQCAVITIQPGLGMWSIIISLVESTKVWSCKTIAATEVLLTSRCDHMTYQIGQSFLPCLLL